ncbi:MAG: hypothetical protein NTV02_01145 [Candidatus Zambryskibacteria bacterium]|nr:hypothetical protein [Candidatus Zambryskibacteria bacterium]
MFSLFKIALIGAILFFVSFGVTEAYSTIDVDITSSGVISAFSVSCTGTNATALLLYGKTSPFWYSVGGYMRRPCIAGNAYFDSFDLNAYLLSFVGAYPEWSRYIHVPLKIVVKDTTDVYAYDAPLYNGLINLPSASNGNNNAVLGPEDTTYPTIAVGYKFDFDGVGWTKVVPPPPVPPESIGDPNDLPVRIASNGDIPRVSINCIPTHNYTLSLVHREEDVVSFSYGVVDRQYCVNGVVSFNGFNINNLLVTHVDSSWWNHVRTPLEYVIKDTTTHYYNVCDEDRCDLVNLDSSSNNYDKSVYLASSTVWTTVGKGPVFTTDDNVTWKNVKDVAPAPYGLSNVLFLPGFEASRLYRTRSLTCQINCEDQLWESNKKSDVEDLYLNSDGTSKKTDIYTRDAISETNTPVPSGFAGQNIYKSFFKTLDDLTDPALPKRMARWETYAYDWRQSVDDIVENGTRYKGGKKSLVATLENLVASSTSGKVTIIAHSNGGLLAKALMVKLQAMKNAGTSDLIDKIDVLVLVASPQIGTAVAVPAVLHGYDQRIGGGLLMDEEHARELGRNMPGAYGLLPSREYINRIDIAPVTFIGSGLPGAVTTPFIQAYGSTTDSYSEYRSFLLGQEGRVNPLSSLTKLPINLSETLLAKSETMHTSIDYWVPPTTMRVVQVAGWGLDTVASLSYVPKYSQVCNGVGLFNCYVLDEKPIFTIDGDKTVVEPSAHYMGGEKYWVNFERYNGQILGGFRYNREHKDILEINSLNNLIKSVMQKTEIVFDAVLKNTKPVDSKNRLRVSIHSPVSIGAYDSFGNFTGKICSDTEDFCYIQEDIPNSSYLEFGEGKYVNMPEEDIQKIVLQGTGSGTFTFISEKVAPTGETSISTFTDIPVTTQTQGEVVLNTVTQAPELKLDVTGDGTTDFTLAPTVEFDPITFLQIMKTTINSFDIKPARKTTLSKRIDGIIKSIQKGKISKAQLKAERFQSVLKVKVAKPLPKKPKPQRFTNADAEVLIGMLETLLNNLEK